MQVLNRRAMQRTRDRRLLQAPALAPAPANASGVTLAPGYFSPVAEVLPAPGMAVPPGAGSPGKALSAFPGLLVLGNKSIAGNSSSGPLLLSSDLPDAPIPPFIVPPPTATVCACLSSCMLCCDLQSPWWVMLVEQQRYSSQCFASAHSKVPAAQTKPSVACNVSTLEVPEFSHKMWLHAICEKNCLNFLEEFRIAGAVLLLQRHVHPIHHPGRDEHWMLLRCTERLLPFDGPCHLQGQGELLFHHCHRVNGRHCIRLLPRVCILLRCQVSYSYSICPGGLLLL